MLMMVLLVILIVLFPACSDRPSSQYITLNVVPHEEVVRVAEEYTGQAGLTYQGYAIWQGDECEIWIVPMEYIGCEWEWERLLGHEVRHCFEGAFHD